MFYFRIIDTYCPTDAILWRWAFHLSSARFLTLPMRAISCGSIIACLFIAIWMKGPISSNKKWNDEEYSEKGGISHAGVVRPGGVVAEIRKILSSRRKMETCFVRIIIWQRWGMIFHDENYKKRSFMDYVFQKHGVRSLILPNRGIRCHTYHLGYDLWNVQKRFGEDEKHLRAGKSKVRSGEVICLHCRGWWMSGRPTIIGWLSEHGPIRWPRIWRSCHFVPREGQDGAGS